MTTPPLTGLESVHMTNTTSHQTCVTFLTLFLRMSVLVDQENTISRLQQQIEHDSQRAKDDLAQLRLGREQVSIAEFME